MIDRYTIGAKSETVRKGFEVVLPDDYRSTFNAGPTQKLPVITNADVGKISMFHWGFMTPMSNGKSISPKLYSAKLEVIESKVSIQNAVTLRKCVILCDGFYLWKKISKKKQVPYYFYTLEKDVFGIAGFWEENEDFESDKKSYAFNMITVPATGKFISLSSDSLPAILTKGVETDWLKSDGYDIKGFLDHDFHGKMQSHSVSPRILDLNNDSSDLIESIPPADQFGNYTLFG